MILWLCKWQLTFCVRAKTPVDSVAIVKEEKQVIKYINNMPSSQKMWLEKSIKQQAGCHHNFSAKYEIQYAHLVCSRVYQAFFSDLSNRLENETNYMQNVCSHAQCIILLSMSGFLYSTASFDIRHCDLGLYKWQLTNWV